MKKNVSNVHATMGWRSKADTARRNNLEKAENPQNPTVEDVEEAEDMDFEEDDLLQAAGGIFFSWMKEMT